MDAAAVLVRIQHVQQAFEVIAALMLTAYLFPKQAVVSDQEQFDFIVVGAGSAGAVVAARLVQSGHSVLLVEAGGDPPLESLTPGLLGYLPQTGFDWKYTTERDNNVFQCHRSGTANLTSGRGLGGGSSINFMFYVRGCAGDFSAWAAAANDITWDWSGVLPYFIKSEMLQDKEINNSPLSVYHGRKGFLGVSRQTSFLGDKYLESFKELGHDIILDINANVTLGYNQPMFTISNGVRQSTAYTVLAPLRNNTRLHLLKNTLVTKIIFDKHNNAIAVVANTKDNKEITLKASREVIVSAGALNTPRLLMLSGIGPKKHLQSLNIPLKSDLPVGENLQDHPGIFTGFNMGKFDEAAPITNPNQFPFDAFTGYVAFNKSNTCPDYQTISFISPSGSNAAMVYCVFLFDIKFEICQKLLDVGLFSATILLHPKSRGRVLLRSTNPGDPPLIHGGYLSNNEDLETLVDYAIDFHKVLETSHFKSVNAYLIDLKLECGMELEFRSREWWRCYAKCMIFSLYHYSGTCALGSVVDSHLRVFGVNRLRVADASVMPEVVSGNTNAATIMIGEKAADFIQKDHI